MKEEWLKIRLGDFTETINGLWSGKKEPFISVKVYTMSNFTKESDLNYFKEPRDVIASVSQFEKRKLQSGDILIEKSGGGPNQPVGRAVHFDIENEEKNTFSNFTTRLRITPLYSQKIYSKYIHKYLKFLYMIGETEKFQNNSTNIRNLQLKEYLNLQIPIPLIFEQKQIVNILDKTFESIEQAKVNIERNLKNKKELFESSIQHIFSDYIDTSIDYTLNSWCELIVDCEHRTAPTQDTGYPSIRTPNVGKGKLILENVRKVSQITYDEWTRRAIPKSGDLIMAREAPAGNVAIIPNNVEVCLGQRTLLIRPKKDKIDSHYLTYLLLTPEFQKKLLSNARGATVTHVNMKDIRNLIIGNLPDIEIQKKVVKKVMNIIEKTTQLEEFYKQKLNNLEELKKSILEKAFSGELLK
jgi:type I restriction enzyme S subunit